MVTDTSEKGLEALICTELAGHSCDPSQQQSTSPLPSNSGNGWLGGDRRDYDRSFCVDLAQLSAFLQDTQPRVVESLDLQTDGPSRRGFLDRLQGEVSKRGVVHVLRRGIKHGALDIDLLYGTPSPGNETAKQRFGQNRFSVSRQLRYSNDEAQRALDMALFINGLPVFTFELKNSLTKQTVQDAIEQYKRDRPPNEKLFELGRCVAHFALDENEVRFCTHLNGKSSVFLPFNRGWNEGAGNPPNEKGLKTDYLWKEVLTRERVTDMLENFAQLVELKNPQTKRSVKNQIWPRYHQFDVVKSLLDHVQEHGAGHRYLIQHSAGSGKSNSIAWLAHQLIELTKDDKPVFDSIIVVTDRRILDQQINETIRQTAQISTVVGHADSADDLRSLINSGKKVIVSTVQKFPFILDEINHDPQGRNFAIIIDEAHSSQGGKTSKAISRALGSKHSEPDGGKADSGNDGKSVEEPDPGATYEDQINAIMERRKLLENASYFAFTATPKNKTLEMFGIRDPQPDGTVKHRSFHNYSMKQAIQEGFILDVLEHFTPINSYYRLAKAIETDPEFDVSKAQKKLRRYVEGHEYAIRLKAEIMVDHFREQVLAQHKLGGKARAMVVTNGVANAIRYFHAINDYLKEVKSPYKAIVAFSGDRLFDGNTVSESTLNDFPSSQISEHIQEDPYRFLICADKFQTGYDEPLLHSMYVDKTLSGIKAVQTLSRLNRTHPEKHDVFILDFQNDADAIRDAFADYYRTTVLADETDPNRLNDLQADLDGSQVYSYEQVSEFVRRYLDDEDREKLDPILDRCVEVYLNDLDEDGQVAFKGKAKAFVRIYDFLACILPYCRSEWEERSIFLHFLIPKLPSPKDEDLSKGILESINMDSYRVEKKAMQHILLDDKDSEIDPTPAVGSSGKPDPMLEKLSNIINEFNSLFGNIDWEDADRVQKLIIETLPGRVENDTKFQNAKRNSDEQNARIELQQTLMQVVMSMMRDDAKFFRNYMNNDDFKRWVNRTVFDLSYRSESEAIL